MAKVPTYSMEIHGTTSQRLTMFVGKLIIRAKNTANDLDSVKTGN